MSTSFSAHATARRNLAQRIDRFLRAHALTDRLADQVLAGSSSWMPGSSRTANAS